jgi:hypothetical protein
MRKEESKETYNEEGRKQRDICWERKIVPKKGWERKWMWEGGESEKVKERKTERRWGAGDSEEKWGKNDKWRSSKERCHQTKRKWEKGRDIRRIRDRQTEKKDI